MSSYIYAYEEMPDDLSLNGATMTDYIETPEIHRILNNKYQFYMVYKLDGQNVDYLKKGNFVKAKVMDGTYQYFELTNPVKNLNSISIIGRHIAFMLNRNFIENSFTSSGNGLAIMKNLYSSLTFKQKFVFDSDVMTDHQFTAKEVQPLEAMIGSNNGNQNLVGVTNGELEMNNYNITLKERIGADNNYRISFGENLDSIEETIDEDGIINSLYLIGGTPENDYNEDKDPIVFKYLEIDGVTDATRRIGKRENSNLTDIDELKKWGQSLFDTDRIHEPSVTHDVSMVDLANTIEYEEIYSKLVKLQFGDTVHVSVAKLNITISERFVECVWYPTIEKYKSMVLGNDLSMYTYQIENKTQVMKQDMINSQTMLVENVKNATAWITGNKGGHVTLRPEKEPNEILIMDEKDVDLAKMLWRWNLGGLGHSKNGINGPYDTAITQDGKIVADFIKAGVLNGVQIQAEDKDFLIDLFNGKINFDDVKTKKRLGALYATYDGDNGKVNGVCLQQYPGYYLSLNSGDDNGSSMPVVQIPSDSTKDKRKLNLFGDVKIEGSLNISGRLDVKELYVAGVKIDKNGGGTGGGGINGGGSLESTEDYAKNYITAEFGVDYEKMYQSYLNFGRINAWGLANRSSFDSLNEIIKGQGVSPVFFWAYEASEGYNPSTSFLNHFETNGSSPQEEARRTAAWIKKESETTGDLAWYDAMYPYYTSPSDKQANGNAYMASTKPGMIARVMLKGTAAATWAMFDPVALNQSVNGVQDYSDPFASQISAIKSWGGHSSTGKDGFALPVKPNTPISSWFGERWGRMHNGIDFAGQLNDPIFASKAGTVVLSLPTSESGGFGEYVVIDHGDGYFSGYAHQNQRMVSVGDKVAQGQQIGVIGNTGDSEGPHLHFSIMTALWSGYLDPAPFLGLTPG